MSKIVNVIAVFVILVAIGIAVLLSPKNDSGPEPSVTPNLEDEIIVDSPQPNQIVSSPILIEGKARGFWFFEASFPVKLFDDKGQEIAEHYVQATDDWMTTDFVGFKGELEYNIMATTTATLILKRDNPSDLPENDKSIEIPIILSPTDSMEISVFFNNDQLDPEFSCNKVFAVKRVIAKTPAIARVALEELLKGATQGEESQGFFTSINPGVTIQKLIIEDGVARIDFDEQLEFQVGGSCRVSAIRSQITETLKQFPTVKDVVISINGRTEDILQP
ncbi:GerMN domain-containing protein [Patescibacteria group bacterium]|nr:GerMN domain-containing protein [Patescibacteria group bacterium]